MAACPVQTQPVSARNSLLSGKNTGKISNTALSFGGTFYRKPHPEQLPTISVECASFPEQGIRKELRRRLSCKLASNLRSRPTDPGPLFPHHPLLRGGFLDDVYGCFEDERLADEVMTRVSEDVPSFTPLIAQRCVLSGWKTHSGLEHSPSLSTTLRNHGE